MFDKDEETIALIKSNTDDLETIRYKSIRVSEWGFICTSCYCFIIEGEWEGLS